MDSRVLEGNTWIDNLGWLLMFSWAIVLLAIPIAIGVLIESVQHRRARRRR